MKLLDLTLKTPQENVALDEALLDHAEAGGEPSELLRLWESPSPMVVIGRSSKIDTEVNRDYCRRRDVAVLRRSSGGAAVVAGPGCLMYAVVLSLQQRPELQMISQAHCFVLGKIIEAIRPFAADVTCAGTSDLTVDGKKFSGNSLRVKRNHLLYHGTLLYDFPLEQISACLLAPPRQPDYRNRRPHSEFVMNIPVPNSDLRRSISRVWKANESMIDWPRNLTEQLVRERYCRREWNERL